jgi:RNA polymerase sigma-70 factor (ECF subfamily)
MSLIAEGDTAAFELIYDRHCNVAFSLAYRMCGARIGAEEVVQEAFLSMWRSGARYDRTRGSVRNWVLRIVHNRAVDSLRRGVTRESKQIYDEGVVERLPAAERVDELVERRDQGREIRGALDGLPSEQSRVIELAYFGGFSHNEIAEMLDTPIGTVKGRMRLGLSKMRVALGEEGQRKL